MTKNDAKTKKKITSSRAFIEWWNARRKMEPVPGDPYRAYMIDKSLRAKVVKRPAWKKRTNRSDVIPIDYPDRPPTKVTRKVPRKPRPKPTTTHKARRRELRRRLTILGEEMSTKYGTDIPQLTIKTGSPEDTSWYKLNKYGVNRYTGQIVTIPGKRPKIQVNFPVGARFDVAEQSYRHEFGHHIDYSEIHRIHGEQAFGEWLKRRKFSRRKSAWKTQETFKVEQRAWKYAKEFSSKENPILGWGRRTFLETYRKRTSINIEDVGGKTQYKYTFGNLRKGIEDVLDISPDI